MLAMTIAQRPQRPSKAGKHPPAPDTFEQAARNVMREVQEALARLVAAVPVPRPPIAKAADLQKALGVDPKLGWRIFRIANASNPLSAGPEVPSRVSMERLFKAAAKHRVPSKVIERASGAFDRFEELVTEYAGDRESLASMINAVVATPGEKSPIDLQQRKGAYVANSHIWGLQAISRIACAIIRPSNGDPTLCDAVYLRGFLGLRQLRPHRPFTISRIAMSDDHGVVRRNLEIERLDVVEDAHGINLLRDFCTKPLPTIRNFVNDQGQLVTQLLNDDVGKGAEFTGFLCDVYRKSIVRYRSESDFLMTLEAPIHFPFEVTHIDALIQRGTFSDRPLRFDVRTENGVKGAEPGPDGPDVLFKDQPASYLGAGADGLRMSEYPRYVEMIEYVMERLGWDPAEFEAYRYRLEYPVMPSSVLVECTLPEPPKPGESGDAE